MRIAIKLFATFRQGRFKVAERDCDPGTTVSDILASLDIEEADIGMLFINGRHAEPEQTLAEGNVLAIFPLVGGG